MRQTKLELHLERALTGGGKLFVPYLTAGLPSPQGFIDLVSEMSRHADAIEIGIPFSDPIMDGPVIQEASTRALEAGISVGRALELIKQAGRYGSCPMVVMTYFNPIHRLGLGEFYLALSEAGVNGVIVPDLPYEESEELEEHLAAADVAAIQMVAPATSPQRAAVIADASSGFVYAVSRMGVTGEQSSLADSARVVVEKVRPHTSLPILLGIGISNGAQASEASAVADGVIVGSAIVSHVLRGDVDAALALAAEIRSALVS